MDQNHNDREKKDESGYFTKRERFLYNDFSQMPKYRLKGKILCWCGAALLWAVLFYLCTRSWASIPFRIVHGLITLAMTFFAMMETFQRCYELGRRMFAYVRQIRMVDRMWLDYRYRTFVFVTGDIFLGGALLIYNLVLSIQNQSGWYAIMAAYYGMIILMRSIALYNEEKYGKEKILEEGSKKLLFTFGFLLMVTSLSLAMILERVLYHDIGMIYGNMWICVTAYYTIFKIFLAASNLVRVTKMRDPLLVCVRCAGWADAMFSLMFLSTALTEKYAESFLSMRAILFLIGTAICLFLTFQGLNLIHIATGKKTLK